MVVIRFVCVFFLLAIGFSTTEASEELKKKFHDPVAEARPWCFWYWMYGAVSKAGITADLEAMKQIGLGGTYLMPIKSAASWPHYPGAVDQLSDEWWEMVRFSMQEADRLDLELGIHICDGFALAGGPWITPEESMQKVIVADTLVKGGILHPYTLPLSKEIKENYYRDIAVMAIPAKGGRRMLPKRITGSNPQDTALFVKEAFRSSEPCWIQFEYEHPYTCYNIEVVLSGNNNQAHRLKVMASDNGVDFRFVKQLKPARQGWQNTDAQTTHAIPPTTARFYRFYWDPEGSEPGAEDLDAAKWRPTLKIKNLILHHTPRINQWEGKAGFVWRVAEETAMNEIPADGCVRKDEIIDLSSLLKDPATPVRLPAGEWRILRFGHTVTGHTNATGGNGKGLECDKFSPEVVKKQFDNWFGMAFEKTDPVLAKKVLKYMHVDSWECGSQNWSKNFAAEFERRRGYSLMPYLPLYAGIPVESIEKSEKVLRDIRTTISELVVDVFYTVLADQAEEKGCEFSAECVSPTMVSDGMLHYKMVDRPMGEFWLRSPTHDKPNDMLDAISGAHVYGKKIVQAEGFTQLRTNWDEDPAMLKPLMDRNFALGINKMFYHVYCHNPYTDQAPGMTLDGIGLYFQRDQTWWKQGRSFVDYTTRCQSLLQYGDPVIDIAVYTGEEIPRRAILPDRLVDMLPGIFGKERVASEKIRKANKGLPLRQMPFGVTHSANMADPEKWINPLRGYGYDSFNKDALVNLATAEGGRLNLPGGASYKILVLPQRHPMDPNGVALSEESRKKIADLRKAGVVIPELPYLSDDFSSFGLERDIIVPQDIAWTHRRGNEADVYFVANQKNEKQTFTASFRIDAKIPEFWNPVNGDIADAATWKNENNRTLVKMTLEANESMFVVFSRDTKPGTVVEAKEEKRERIELPAEEWKVSFLSLNGVSVKRDTLFDWSLEEDEKIKYYSGTALYTSSFQWNERNKREGQVWLEFEGMSNMASVKINGEPCGTVWTAPYRLDISKALKRGRNRIEIEVTNTWANAMNGADKGKAPFLGIWSNGKYRMKEDMLLPAGIYGKMFILK